MIVKSSNQRVETNRRPAAPYHHWPQFGSASCARPFLSAAVAHPCRSAGMALGSLRA